MIGDIVGYMVVQIEKYLGADLPCLVEGDFNKILFNLKINGRNGKDKHVHC